MEHRSTRCVFIPFSVDIWGAGDWRRIGQALRPGDDYAESWEICDHGDDQSVVDGGPLAGATLAELVADMRRPCWVAIIHRPIPLAGEVHRCRRPSPFRSIPTTPRPPGSSRRTPARPRPWVVMAAEPGSTIYAGLQPGVDRQSLADAIPRGRATLCSIASSLCRATASFSPPARSTPMGQGLLVAEIQQSSNVTFGCSIGTAWARTASRGPCTSRKPLTWSISPADRSFRSSRSRPGGRASAGWSIATVLARSPGIRLRPTSIGGDGRCHISACWKGPFGSTAIRCASPLWRGSTALVPAALGAVRLTRKAGRLCWTHICQ